MMVGAAAGRADGPHWSSPVRGGGSHGQRGDGADGLRVRVSPQAPPLRLLVGQIHGVGRVHYALPVLTCRGADEKKEGLMLGVVYISVFFVLLSILDVSSGAGACTALLKKSRWSLILRPELFDVQRSIDRVLNSPQSQRPC